MLTDSGVGSLKRYDLLVKNNCSMLNVDWLHRAFDFGAIPDKVTDFTTDFRKSQKSNMLFPEIIARIVFNTCNFASCQRYHEGSQPKFANCTKIHQSAV